MVAFRESDISGQMVWRQPTGISLCPLSVSRSLSLSLSFCKKVSAATEAESSFPLRSSGCQRRPRPRLGRAEAAGIGNLSRLMAEICKRLK